MIKVPYGNGPHPKVRMQIDGPRIMAMQGEVQKTLDLAGEACASCLQLDWKAGDVPEPKGIGQAIEWAITGGPKPDPTKLERVIFCPTCFEISRQALLDTVGILDDLKKYLQPLKCEPVTPRKDED